MSDTNALSVTSADLPALYKATDKTSVDSQTEYLQLFKADLIMLLLGALLTSISVGNPDFLQLLAVLGGLLLAASFVITIMLSMRNFEQQWYGGRAMAESVKTVAWKYMCGAEPFKVSCSQEETNRLFRKNLQDVLDQADELSMPLSGNLASQPQITQKMLEIRSQSLEERKRIYLDYRIQQQREWYTSKASLNQSNERLYFKAVIAAQFLAFACSLFLVANPGMGVNLPSVFSALAAMLIAWMQIKRYQELSQSYSIAAHELGLISVDAFNINSEDKFAKFVADAEAAISREHTLWVARRNISLARR